MGSVIRMGNRLPEARARLFRTCFFFSSRRRHTRCSRDWSSDVCSSDLAAGVPRRLAHAIDRCLEKDPLSRPQKGEELAEQLGLALEQRRELPVGLRVRSEEHTSELQSRLHLACRLLLEKKKLILRTRAS